MLVEEAGCSASDWDPYCSYRSWSTNIWLLHIFSKYFPFWLNPRRPLWEKQIQFMFIVLLYILSISWLVWVLNIEIFLNLNLVNIIFTCFAIILKGISFIYIGYIFIIKLKLLFGNIETDDMLIEIQSRKCQISWIKSFMNEKMEIKISSKINKFLILSIILQIISIILWYFAFINNEKSIPRSNIANETGNIIFRVLWYFIIFIVIGISMIMPYCIISCILYLRIQDMTYLISNQQFFNKILDLYAIICSQHNLITNNNDITNDEHDDEDNDDDDDEYKHNEYIGGSHQIKIPRMDHDCRGLIKFYQQIYIHFNKFFNIFKYWFILSGLSVIIFIWIMISQIYSNCIHSINKYELQCFGVISFTFIFLIYLLCLIIIIFSAINITKNANELEKCIEYTLNKCIIDSMYKKGIKTTIQKEKEWNKEIIVLQRLSVLTLKKPLHFQIFGVKITKLRIISFIFVFITAKTMELLYEFLK